MPPRKRRTRGHIGELPSGSYRVTVYAGTDPLTGKPRQLRETVPDRKTAEAALTRLQGQVDEDRHPKSNITVHPRPRPPLHPRLRVPSWTAPRPPRSSTGPCCNGTRTG